MKNFLLTAAAAVACATAVIATATASGATPNLARSFQNCTEMHKVYPHGVGKLHAHDHATGTPVTNFKHSNELYAANKKSDRDHDSIACEAH